MKKNNLILGTFLAITAILFSSCGASPSSDSTSTEKVEGSTESTSTEKVEGSAESTESGGVVTIGTQVWTSTNLDVSTFRNGDPIPQAKTDAEWKGAGENKQPAWCYYDNDPSNGTKYGKLYNWYAVNDPRGLAPKGYHIPTDAEWTKLSDYLGGSGAGTKMKSTSGWKNDGNGNNSSGFSGLPGGYNSFIGTFIWFDFYGYWWSSSEDDTNSAWSRILGYSSGSVLRSYYYKVEGLSVRCLRD
jgi:uncharacterized protein (TIGR02145 family)